MIKMEHNRIEQGGISEDIIKWGIVFFTPFGWTHSLKHAIDEVKAKGLDPDTVIVPVAIAISETMEEVFVK